MHPDFKDLLSEFNAKHVRLCAEYKTHPKLMVSIQDDDFFNAYR